MIPIALFVKQPLFSAEIQRKCNISAGYTGIFIIFAAVFAKIDRVMIDDRGKNGTSESYFSGS